MSTVEERVIQKINNEIGSDIKNLHKCKNLVKSFQNDIEIIESKISCENIHVTSNIKSALNLSEITSNKIDDQIEKINDYDQRVSEKIDSYEIILDGINERLTKIRKLSNLVGYFKILQDIQDISNDLASSINGKDDFKCVSLYMALCGDIHGTDSVLGRLHNVNAPHLKKFSHDTAIYWQEILKEKFSKEYENILKIMKWPHLQQSTEPCNPSKETLNKLSTIAEYLFLLKSPDEPTTGCIKITPTIICPPISIPIQLLLKPFRQRFLFHFSGTRQTNRLDKPEWYLTQILSWIRDNQMLVSQNLQTAALKAGINEINVRLEFVRGLVQLAIEKLCIDIDDICRDESLFSHLLDEILSFEQELKDLVKISFLSNFPTTITVLTQAQYIMKWLDIEEKFSTDKMDKMLKTGLPWEYLDTGSVEDLKIPRCADQFIRLLDAIRERYCGLPQPGHQLQFLNLQIELIDNFRTRLVHLHNSTVDNVSTSKILNALNYITTVLREWGENVHYLHLHAALVNPVTDEINSVFDESVEKLETWQRKLIKELSFKIVDEIKAKSMPYRHDVWISMAEPNSKETFMLSTTAGEMFQVMVTNIHNLETDLSANLFSTSLRLIAQRLDDFFIDSMIMNTKFSTGGATQFHFDMIRNLFALFGQYSRRPEVLFKKVQNACVLLTLPRGSTILLHQTIKGETNLEKTTTALKEIGVLNLSVDMAIDIIERRIDICI